jgi:hypothetical protein
MKKKTLHLTLNKKWFDMILSGLKTEEYREIKKYWVKRFVLDVFKVLNCDSNTIQFENLLKTKGLQKALIYIGAEMSSYETITFSNGYAKNKPQFEIEFKGFEIGRGKQEWGAENKEKYFILKLGEIINKTNIK